MQQDAIDCAYVALNKFNDLVDIAEYIANEFDKKYDPTNPKWQCFVGTHFGAYVTTEAKKFIYFYMG